MRYLNSVHFSSVRLCSKLEEYDNQKNKDPDLLKFIFEKLETTENKTSTFIPCQRLEEMQWEAKHVKQKDMSDCAGSGEWKVRG